MTWEAMLENEEQTQSPTIAALRALNDLVDTARATAAQANKKRRGDIANRCLTIALQLDGVRTRLVQDGKEYLDTAWVYVDTSRRYLATYRLVVS